MNKIHRVLFDFMSYLDDNSYIYEFDPYDVIADFKEKMKKDLYNKMEITIYKDGKKIIYDDLSGVITYFNNDADCIEVNVPITTSIQDIYKKMELICIELNLPSEL